MFITFIVNVTSFCSAFVAIRTSFDSPFIASSISSPLYPVIVFVATTPVGAIYFTSVWLVATVLLESPFFTVAAILVFVVGVNLFNVMSAVNTTVAPCTAGLLYFVCVPSKFAIMLFVPFSLSTTFASFIVNSSSKNNCVVFKSNVSMLDGKSTLTVGFLYIISSALSFSSVTFNSTFSFFTIVDNLLLLIAIPTFGLGSSNAIFFTSSLFTISVSPFFAIPTIDVFRLAKVFIWFAL